MNVTQVKDLFLSYVGESDLTFMDDGLRRRYLELGYNEFRDTVMSKDSWFYVTTVDITVTGVTTYDLGAAASAVRILGNPLPGGLTGPRLHRLGNIVRLTNDAAKRPYEVLYGASRLDAIMPFSGNDWTFLASRSDYDYILIGTKLELNLQYTGDLRIYYVPVQSTNWTLDGTADTEFIDDLASYHDVIALLAANHYQAADGEGNKVLQGLLRTRLDNLSRYLTEGRDYDTQGQAPIWR